MIQQKEALWRVIPLSRYTIHEFHSLEETLYERVRSGESPPTVVFAQIDPSAVSISEHQNLQKDVNTDLCQRIGVHVARRTGSGRSVYLDANYFVISMIGRPRDFNVKFGQYAETFAYFCRKVVRSLRDILGTYSVIERDNDLVIEGKKIGGVSQIHKKDVVVVNGFIRYEKSWELPLQLLKIDNVPLYPYINEVNGFTTAVTEVKKMSYGEFTDMLMERLLSGMQCKVDSMSAEEKKLRERIHRARLGTEWIQGTGHEQSRGNCDVIAGKRLKISALEGRVHFS